MAWEYRAGYSGAWPETWIEFVLGLSHLSRASSAEKLRLADSVAATKDSDGWRQWVRDHRTLAGQ